MTPNTTTTTSLDNNNSLALTNSKNQKAKIEFKLKERKSSSYFEQDLKWFNIVGIFLLHVLTIYAFLTFPYFSKKTTLIFGVLFGVTNGFGVTVGAHRLWTHKAYKAKWPLRVILLSFFYASGQNSLTAWVKDHRVHHKYTETEADPHNSKRGFFFSHVGWLMMQKHPEVIRRGKELDLSDLQSDPVVVFGEKYYFLFKIILCYIIPITIPVYFWNESWYWGIVANFVRYTYTLNATWSVNSFAHIWGTKPYDKTIAPVENKFVSFVALGEGWHNYHHVFPYDYKASELGDYGLNYGSWLIDNMAKIGWAYDLKQPSKELIEAVRSKRGDIIHVD